MLHLMVTQLWLKSIKAWDGRAKFQPVFTTDGNNDSKQNDPYIIMSFMLWQVTQKINALNRHEWFRFYYLKVLKETFCHVINRSFS